MGLSQLESEHGSGLSKRLQNSVAVSGKKLKHTRSRRPHPLVLLVFALGLVLMEFGVHKLLLEFLLFLNAIFLTMSVQGTGKHQGLAWLAWSAPWILVYTGFTALLMPHSAQALWQGPHIPLLGTLALSWQGITLALTDGLRLWAMFISVMSMGRMVRVDDITAWLGVRFARTSLTLAMVLSFIPNLQAERLRLVELNAVRGADFTTLSLKHRVRQSFSVYLALLQNALERSWILAESMYVRGYGSTRRSFYRPPVWRKQDVVLMSAALGLLLLAIMLWFVPADSGTRGALSPWLSVYPMALVVLEVLLSVWLGGKLNGTN